MNKTAHDIVIVLLIKIFNKLVIRMALGHVIIDCNVGSIYKSFNFSCVYNWFDWLEISNKEKYFKANSTHAWIL